MSRYAAIDIGSNSIRLLAAEMSTGQPMRVLAADRQVVRLGAGVFKNGRLTEPAMALAFEVLARMAGQYAGLELAGIRAVGTAALRDASNQEEFLGRASEILGTPVEVISGLEEARLIHLGVQTQWPHPRQNLLVIDIGGGSAEIVLSEAGVLTESFSKPLGAVRLTEMYLKGNPPDPHELTRLEKYVQERIAGPAARFSGKKIHRMIGTSSTVAAVVCAVNNIRRSRRDQADRQRATAAQVRQLYRRIVKMPVAERATVTGIGPRRAELIAAGAGVIHLTMQQMRLPSLYYSIAGVRDGIVADLAHGTGGAGQARLSGDQRRVVRAMVRKYGILSVPAAKVASLANMLFDGLRLVHKLPLASGRLLEAAAHLYNIGHYVNEARHHRHSMYLVANSDLPGFTAAERLAIANLCRYHRKSMPQASHELFQAMAPEDRRAVTLLTPLLRLAVALDQSQEQKVDRVEAVANGAAIELRLHSDADVDNEQWHAEQVAGLFEAVYGLPLTVKVKR